MTRRINRGIAVFALALVIILLIALAQRWNWLTPFNHSVMVAAGAARDTATGQGITRLMLFASEDVGDTLGRIILTLTVTAWLWWKRSRADALWLLLVVIGGTLLNLGLKQVFAAPRPDLLPHLDIVKTYSFPSGHAAGNMIFFGGAAIGIGQRWAWVVAACAILLIGISRIWLGVHWPTDVLAGWVEGIGWLTLCVAWMRR